MKKINPLFMKKVAVLGMSALLIGATLTTGEVVLNAASKSVTSSSTKISLTSAKSAALKHAGFSASEVKFIKAKLDSDYDDDDYDDELKYEIDFTTSSRKYEYEIDAYTSEVIEFSSKKIKSNSTNTTNKNYIGVTAAKKVAITHAKLTGEDVIYTTEKLTRDDGIYVYDIEFNFDGADYEYEINAKTGKIIDFDMDMDD